MFHFQDSDGKDLFTKEQKILMSQMADHVNEGKSFYKIFFPIFINLAYHATGRPTYRPIHFIQL